MSELSELEGEHTPLSSKRPIINILIFNDNKKMKCDISKATAPTMPNLGRRLESVALLLSQPSKDMHQPIVQMLFLILGNTQVEPKSCIQALLGRELAV